jgi:hypothetical protein
MVEVEMALEEMRERKGILCGPVDPTFDAAAAAALAKETGTDLATDWRADTEMHGAAKADSVVIEKLAPQLVRILPESEPLMLTFVRVLAPSRKVGYVDWILIWGWPAPSSASPSKAGSGTSLATQRTTEISTVHHVGWTSGSKTHPTRASASPFR